MQSHLDELGFNLVGYGCTTCIGNSGPLAAPIEQAIDDGKLTVSAVLSGNRNYEGRIHAKVRAAWLASPPLVVAFALAGTTNINLNTDPLGQGSNGEDVFLKDIWPNSDEIATAVRFVENQMFNKGYADVFSGDAEWNSLPVSPGKTYPWDSASTYIQKPPFCELEVAACDIYGARILMLLGDSVTTDHISPAGSIAEKSPAGEYLLQRNIPKTEFNSYGSRRGNHEVMVRGTLSLIHI